MKIRQEHKIVVLGFLGGALLWLTDAILDKVNKFPHEPFIKILLYDAPTHEFIIRPIMLLSFTAFGVLIAFYMTRMRKSEGRYHSLFDSVNDIILVGSLILPDYNCKFIDVNLMAIQKLGYTKEELLGLGMVDLVAPEKLPEFLLTKEALQSSHPVVYETTLVSKDGKNIPVEIDAYEIDLGGEVVYLFIVRDMSGRLEREKEIRRLASMPQFDPNPILEIDASGRVTYCNEAGTKILQKLEVLEGPSIFLADWDRVMEEIIGHPGRELCREVKIKDAVFTEYIQHIPELGVVRLYAVDITARKRGEEALQKAKEELEKKVEERTGELTLAYQNLLHEIEERQQAEGAVRESSRQLQTLTFKLLNAEENERRLLSLTLHDDLGQDLIFLKYKITPLTKKLGKDKQAKANLDVVFQKLDEVIDKVRQISRYLSPTILEEVGFTGAIKHLFEEFCTHFNCTCRISDKMVETGELSSRPHDCHLLETDGIDDLLSHLAQVNLYRILQETLTNISKHSQATRVLVVTKKGEGHISLTVEDNGKGFDVQKTMTAGSLYRGLGLVSMQERVRMLGGSFNIESREGSGTKIEVIIPIDDKRGE